MGNIYTYLKWRGDLNFVERPFCEVDNLILSELCYMDFSDIVPSTNDGRTVTLEEAAQKYLEYGRETVINIGTSHKDAIVLPMADTARYRAVTLSKYIDITDRETGTEFAAMHIGLGDGTTYIAFRGTCDDLVGWREDFGMSFEIMPTQKSAVSYLNTTINDAKMRYRVGGHSKGGHLAVYGAMLCEKEKQDQIVEIYSNDGPGMCNELVDMKRYEKIADKVIRIVPEFCVVGNLLNKDKAEKIVASSVSGFMQHEVSTWQVEGDHFCTVSDYASQCKFFNEILDSWVESISMSQRKAFVNDFFDALESNGIHKMSDFSKTGIEEVENILIAITHSDRKTQIVIGRLAASLLDSFKSIDFKSVFKSQRAIQGIIYAVIGLLFILFPTYSTKGICWGLGIFTLVSLGKKLFDSIYNSEDTSKPSRYKIFLYVIGMCLLSFFLGKTSWLQQFTNMIVGVFFLVLSYRQVRKAANTKAKVGVRILILLFAGVLFVVGLLPIILIEFELARYALVIGIGMFIYGNGKIMYSMYQSGIRNISGKN